MLAPQGGARMVRLFGLAEARLQLEAKEGPWLSRQQHDSNGENE